MAHTVFHTCSLCEATCGLKFEVEDNRIVSVRGDDDDVFSRGYVCPKGIAIADVHHDPDRLRRPVRRNATGDFEEISWDEAFDLVAGRLPEIRARHGSDAIGFYWGNPTGNNHGALLMVSSLTKAIGTRNRFSAGSQDANPRIVTSYELYGSSISIPIPDIDRTDYFLCLGGNPMISNGSVMTAPDMRRRLRAVRGCVLSACAGRRRGFWDCYCGLDPTAIVSCRGRMGSTSRRSRRRPTASIWVHYSRESSGVSITGTSAST